MITIYVFTLPGCLACTILKSSLNRENVSFIDVDITINKDLWNYIRNQGVSDFLPAIFIKSSESDDGDFDSMNVHFNETQQIVDIIKNNY